MSVDHILNKYDPDWSIVVQNLKFEEYFPAKEDLSPNTSLVTHLLYPNDTSHTLAAAWEPHLFRIPFVDSM